MKKNEEHILYQDRPSRTVVTTPTKKTASNMYLQMASGPKCRTTWLASPVSPGCLQELVFLLIMYMHEFIKCFALCWKSSQHLTLSLGPSDASCCLVRPKLERKNFCRRYLTFWDGPRCNSRATLWRKPLVLAERFVPRRPLVSSLRPRSIEDHRSVALVQNALRTAERSG